MNSPSPPHASALRRASVLQEVRSLWHLAWPILIGQLATIGMSVTDVAMAGHASAQDLAGVSLGVSIYHIIIITIMGLVMSVAPMVAQHVGAGHWERVPHVVRQGLWKGLGIGCVALLVAHVSARVFDHLAIEPAVRDVAKPFVQVISFSLPAFACYRVLYGYSTSINQTKPMMVVSLVALVLNFVINWLLVFGHWGFPRLGGVGCAWATLICVWFNLAALLAWMRWSPAYRRTWPFHQFEAPHGPKLKKMMRLGLPIGITYFAETSAFSLIALLIAKFGSTQVAAHHIALNFTSLTFMVPMSLSLALLTRVGQSLGAQDPRAARFRAWVGVGVGLVFAVISAGGMALFNQQIANAYTSDTAVAALAAHLLIFAAIFQLSDCTQVVVSGAIRGYKVTRAPMVLHLAAFWGASLPLGCLLGLAPAWAFWKPAEPMQAVGFWIALIVGLTVAATGLLWMLRSISNDRVAQGRPTAPA